MGINLNNPEEFGWIELLDLVENQINDDDIITEAEKSSEKFNASKFMKTALKAYQAPTEKAGAKDTEERKEFEFFISRQVVGNTIQEKINSINKFVSATDKTTNKISTILSHCGTIMVLQKIVEDFNPSAGGFAFEAFMAALLKGKQIVKIDAEAGSLPIEDVELGTQPVSLKLLQPKGDVKGSIANLLDFFVRTGKSQPLEYILAVKHRDKHLAFHSFTISPENFFDWISPKYFDWKKIPAKKPKRLTKEEKHILNEVLTDPEEIEKRVERNKKITQPFFRFWGVEGSKSPDSLDFDKWLTKVSGIRTLDKKVDLLSVAVPHEQDFQLSKVFQYKNDLFLSKEEIQIYNNGTRPKGMSQKKWEQNINTMFSKISARRSHFYQQAVHYWKPNHVHSAYYMNVLHGMRSDRVEPVSYSEQREYLNTLLDKGKYKEWHQILKKALKEEQFKIPQGQVVSGKRQDATLYGVVTVNKKTVENILEQYAGQLSELCAPIYAALGELTDNINKFYLLPRSRDKVNAAYRASRNSVQLNEYTDRLTEDTE